MSTPGETDPASSPVRRVKGNGRDHWMPMNVKDCLNDPCLSVCSLATQGAWNRMVLVMFANEVYELTGTIAQLSLTIGRSTGEVKPAIFELAETGTADVFVMAKDGKTLLPFSKLHGKPMAKDVLVIRSRRMYKERSLSNLRSEAGRIGAEKRWQTYSKDDSKRIAPSSSSSTSSSLSSSSSYDTSSSNDVRDGVIDRCKRSISVRRNDGDDGVTCDDVPAPHAKLAKPANREFVDDEIPF